MCLNGVLGTCLDGVLGVCLECVSTCMLPGKTRDFVDYDANLIAAALGIADNDRARRMLNRIDHGTCTRAATFVSERRSINVVRLPTTII